MTNSTLIPSLPLPVTSPKSPQYIFVFIEVLGCEGGIQSYIKDVLSAYGQLDGAPKADVFLLRDGPETPPDFEVGSLQFHYFKSERSMVSRIHMTLALTRQLIRQQPTHVFCGHINLATMISRLCKTFNVPYTVLTYGKEVWYPLPPKDQKALASAHSIWTISRYSRDLACQANQLDPRKIHMLPCVVDGDTFYPDDPKPQLHQKYGLEPNIPILMTVARLWPGDIYKGVDVTIRAMPILVKKFPKLQYLVIGRGNDQPRLAKLATDLGVENHVIFAGFVPTEDLIDHYRMATVYVMPSKEGFGIVYLEAMACGIPVIAGNDDGSADPLQDGRMGWQVPHRNPEAVAAACVEALQGNDPRCNGVWLRQETLQQFSAGALTRQLAQLLPKPATDRLPAS